MAVAVVVLIMLLAIAFAAGYFTRDYVSRKRRAEARRWRGYTEPGWLNAAAPANTNEIADTDPAEAAATGELGRCLTAGRAGRAPAVRDNSSEVRRAVGHLY